MSVRKGNDVLAGSAPLKIDALLSTASANPVQNKVVAIALSNKQDTVSAGDAITIIDNTITVGNIDCGTMS